MERFWATMRTNDFQAVGELLHDDYVLEWPQSGERIRGRANFVAINENYPAHGRWEFKKAIQEAVTARPSNGDTPGSQRVSAGLVE